MEKGVTTRIRKLASSFTRRTGYYVVVNIGSVNDAAVLLICALY
jgi:hypothetical protein